MDRQQQIEVSVVVGDGDFTLRLNGVSLNVRLKNGHDGQTTPHFEVRSILPAKGGVRDSEAALPAPPPDCPADAAHLAEEVAYYRQTSQEIYEGLGRLAKEINLSIQDLSLAELIQPDMTSPGENLDQVRNQVTDILEMTEKATLNILNLVEHIQEDCLEVQGHLLQMANGNGASKEAASTQETEPGGPEEPGPLCSLLRSQGEALDRLIREHFHSTPPMEEASPQVSLPDILQLLLEFCSNEAVKPHLKSVQAQYEAFFQVGEAERSLVQLTVELPQEDGFFQFPVDKVLAILQENCTDERVKELFSKLQASAAKIFPTSTFPLESQPSENVSTSAPQPEVAARWQEFYASLQTITENPQDGHSGADASGLEDRLRQGARDALTTVERINDSLSRITEALAFQDLSGQRLLKVLTLLRQLQVQVLTLLVAAGNKLKVKIEGKEIVFTESEISAQEELYRMLHTCTQLPEDPAPPDIATEQQPLNQEAINDLLTGMGF